MSDRSAAAPDLPAAKQGWRSLVKALKILVFPVLWIGALFAGAGRLDWTRGWLSVAIYCMGMAALATVVRRYNAPLMEARAKWRHRGTKPFDRIILGILMPLTIIQPALAGMDVVRYRWSSMPAWSLPVGAIGFALALILIGWTMVTNRFAESTVRIQTDRGHTVISSGPYRIVRHPMYAGAIAMYAATPLLWGSVCAMAVTGILVVLFVCRTALEDGTLRRELPGYEEFTRSTKYRLLPLVW